MERSPEGRDAQRLIAASNRSASTRSSNRRMVDLDRQFSDPLGDRDKRPRPGRDRAHRRGEHHDEPLPHTVTLTPINNPAHHLAQTAGERDLIGCFTPPLISDSGDQQRMQMRALFSSGDQAWCENRKITTGACPHPHH